MELESVSGRSIFSINFMHVGAGQTILSHFDHSSQGLSTIVNTVPPPTDVAAFDNITSYRTSSENSFEYSVPNHCLRFIPQLLRAAAFQNREHTRLSPAFSSFGKAMAFVPTPFLPGKSKGAPPRCANLTRMSAAPDGEVRLSRRAVVSGATAAALLQMTPTFLPKPAGATVDIDIERFGDKGMLQIGLRA